MSRVVNQKFEILIEAIELQFFGVIQNLVIEVRVLLLLVLPPQKFPQLFESRFGAG